MRSNSNLVCVEGENGVVEVGFNIGGGGGKGLGGVRVEGKVCCYEVKSEKKGRVYLCMNVMGSGIWGGLDISMGKGRKNGRVRISGNFNCNGVRVKGVIVGCLKR